MSFFYAVTSGCTGVLGAAGMGDVCALYVAKPCGGTASWKNVVRERRTHSETPPAWGRDKAGILTTPGCQKYSLLSPGQIAGWVNILCKFIFFLYVPKEISVLGLLC